MNTAEGQNQSASHHTVNKAEARPQIYGNI